MNWSFQNMKSEATDRLIERKKDWTRTEIQKAAKKVHRWMK